MSIEKNSEILFIYDAKMSNPNGDMDDENKPRMDYDTETNLVSDVRLKRYIRDYFETAKDKEIFVTENAKDAKDRGAQLKKGNKTHKDLIDVRLFGAVFAESGANTHLTGPVQFNWGYSLNKVTLCDTQTITSSFSSGEGIGKDFRVNYSLIAFNGTINAKTAEGTGLADADLIEFDEAMIRAIPFCKTRSKEGQTPRLYIRVELKDNITVLKDLREYVKVNYSVDGHKVDEHKVRNIDEVNIDLSELKTYLDKQKSKIGKIYVWKDDKINIKGFDIACVAFENID